MLKIEEQCVLVWEWKVGKIFFLSFFLPLKHHAADKQWKALTKWDPEFILDLKSSYHKVQFSSCSGAFNHIAFSLSEEGLAVRVKCWESNLKLGWYAQSTFFSNLNWRLNCMCMHACMQKKKRISLRWAQVPDWKPKGWFKNAIIHKSTMAHVAFHKAESENL